MGRVKEQLLEEHPNDIADYSYEYELWLKSDEYISMVNDEIADTNIQYSSADVGEAVCFAFGAVQVTQNEVGSEVYSKLIHNRIFEYLNQ